MPEYQYFVIGGRQPFQRGPDAGVHLSLSRLSRRASMALKQPAAGVGVALIGCCEQFVGIRVGGHVRPFSTLGYGNGGYSPCGVFSGSITEVIGGEANRAA